LTSPFVVILSGCAPEFPWHRGGDGTMEAGTQRHSQRTGVTPGMEYHGPFGVAHSKGPCCLVGWGLLEGKGKS
jgi:hypothetical protein